MTAVWLQMGDTDKAIDALLESKQERIEVVLKGKKKTLRGLAKPSELAKELLEAMFGIKPTTSNPEPTQEINEAMGDAETVRDNRLTVVP